MSTLRVDNLNSRTGTSINVPTGTRMYLPGHVIQMQSATLTSIFASSTTGTWTATGLSVAITPTSTSSKIFIQINLSTGQSTAGWATSWGVQRNGVVVGGGVSVGASPAGVWCSTDCYQSDAAAGLCGSYLDSPASTSSLAYQVYYWGEGNTGYLNRYGSGAGGGGNGNIQYATHASTISVWEIAQ